MSSSGFSSVVQTCAHTDTFGAAEKNQSKFVMLFYRVKSLVHVQCLKDFLLWTDGAHLSMANIEEEEEEAVVVELEPPKRKKIATLKVDCCPFSGTFSYKRDKYSNTTCTKLNLVDFLKKIVKHNKRFERNIHTVKKR